MSVIREFGKRWPIPGHPNCQVYTGGPDCVTPHMAVAAKAVARRQDEERAALVRPA